MGKVLNQKLVDSAYFKSDDFLLFIGFPEDKMKAPNKQMHSVWSIEISRPFLGCCEV